MISVMYVPDGQQKIAVQVIRSTRKTLGLEVKRNLEVYARIPVNLAPSHCLSSAHRGGKAENIG